MKTSRINLNVLAAALSLSLLPVGSAHAGGGTRAVATPSVVVDTRDPADYNNDGKVNLDDLDKWEFDWAMATRAFHDNPCLATALAVQRIAAFPTIWAQAMAGGATRGVAIPPVVVDTPNPADYNNDGKVNLDDLDGWEFDWAMATQAFHNNPSLATALAVQRLAAFPVIWAQAMAGGGTRAVAAPPVVVDTRKSADFDGDGRVTLDDMFKFLTAYLAGNPSADIDGIPGISIGDLTAFMSLWIASYAG